MITPDVVKTEIARILGYEAAALESTTPLSDLVIDSLDLVELVLGLEEIFSIRLVEEDLGGVRTLAELTDLVLLRDRSYGERKLGATQ